MTNEIKFQKQDIGGELLPILTTGLYHDAFDTLREYIQNSIDAKAHEITLKIDPDQIVLADNGNGMSSKVARRAIRLGISDKNPTTNVGFRGIGIYSSFNMCDEVKIYTKADGDDAYLIHFDFKQIRHEIKKEQERRKSDLDSRLCLEDLLNNSVRITTLPEGKIETKGTKVVLIGVLNTVFERLNNWDEVVSYLEKVVPLPFKDGFGPAKEIEKEFKEQDYPVVALKLEMGDRTENIFRPYTNDMFSNGGKHPVKFIKLKYKGQSFGFAWICLNDARTYLRSKPLRGLLIKKFGFSISDRTFLEPYFPRTVFYRRMTGEIIIQNDQLIPNAARSDFEYNSTRQDFYTYLPQLVGEVSKWADKIQADDIAQEVFFNVIEELQKINTQLPAARRNKETMLLFNNQLQNITRELAKHITRLRELAPDRVRDAEDLLNNSKKIVESALTETRASAKKLEKEIAASLAKRKVKISDEERARVRKTPSSIIELADSFDLLRDQDVRLFITFLDQNVIQEHLSDKDYKEAIANLLRALEE